MTDVDTNVIAPSTPLIGRDAEMQSVLQLLEQGERLITILGPPGGGKTRLATHLALRSQATYAAEGGVWWVDASFAQDVTSVVRVLSETLGIPLAGSEIEASAEQMSRAIAARGSTLLIVDNFEHLVQDGAKVIEAIVDWAPEAQVLVTSRERLLIEGERVFDLGPMSLPEAGAPVVQAEAVRLFVARTQAARGDYVLTREDEPWVSEICGRVDGLPLAIELVAARMRALGAKEICQKLREGWEVLAPSRGQRDPRHATLERAIDWSWSLLDDVERSAWMQASVFRGGFDLAAAEHVISVSEHGLEVMDALQALCDKSLIDVRRGHEGAARYRMLSCLRDFGVRKLGHSDLEEVTRGRHMRHFAEVGGQLLPLCRDSPPETHHGELETEWDNLRAAFEHAAGRGAGPEALALAVALGQLLHVRGPFQVAIDTLGRALSIEVEGAEALRCQARCQLANGLARFGRVDDALEELAAALEEIEPLALPEAEALVRVTRGGVLGFDGDARALDDYGMAVKLLPPNARSAIQALFGLAVVHAWRGDEKEADRAFEIAMSRMETAKADEVLGRALRNIGWFQLKQGRLRESRLSLERSLSIAEELHNHLGITVSADLLGLLALEEEQLTEARRWFRTALEAARATGSPLDQGVVLTGFGNLCAWSGEWRRARVYLEEALALIREAQNPTYECITLCYLSAVRAATGDVAASAGDLMRAERLQEESRGQMAEVARRMLSLYRGFLALSRAEVAQAAGDTAKAQALLEEAQAPLDREMSGDQGATHYLVRFVATFLQRALSGDAPSPEAQEERVEVLRVGPDADWFEVPGRGRAQLRRRAALRGIMRAFLSEHEHRDGSFLTSDELFAAGWPGQQVNKRVASGRVYTALSRLRQLGLDDVLVTSDEGYRIDPDVRIVAAAPD